MAIEFKLPDIGEGVAEGEITRWLVQEGDQLQEDQPMVEVMTDKATVEITSPANAKVAKLLFAEGDVVLVHSTILVLDDGAGGAASAPESAAPSTKSEGSASTPPPTPPAAAAAAPAPKGDGSKALATPATRKLARTLGIDINQVSGTGPRGRVTKDDVKAFAEGGAPAAAPAAKAQAPAAPVATNFVPGEDTVIPYRGIRRAVGDQMVRSAFGAPHFTLVEEVDFSHLWKIRKTAAAHAAEQGIKFSFLPLIIRALVSAIRKEPSINALFDPQKEEITQKADVHVGIATDTDRGLMVPVVRDADKRTLLGVAAEISRLADAARSGSIARDELTGSTITITTTGSIGGLIATPIINYPEVAILGVYQIKDKPVVRGGEVVPGKVGMISITLDHRIVDGATAARVLAHMRLLLESPALLLVEG